MNIPLSRLKANGVSYEWNGRFIKKQLAEGFELGLKRIGRHGVRRVRRKLRANKGSIDVGQGKVKRVEHSNPGEVPFQQTKNLENSYQWVWHKEGFIQTVTIFSGATYSATLEEGGFSEVDPPLEFTSKRLVNPIPVVVYVAPRPHLQPTMEEEGDNFIKIVKRAVSETLGTRKPRR